MKIIEDNDNNNENNNNNINNNIVNTNNNIIIQNPVINQIRDKIKRKEITLGNQTVTTQIKLNKSIFIKIFNLKKKQSNSDLYY
jgi:predicted nucleic acid-binding protein